MGFQATVWHLLRAAGWTAVASSSRNETVFARDTPFSAVFGPLRLAISTTRYGATPPGVPEDTPRLSVVVTSSRGAAGGHRTEVWGSGVTALEENETAEALAARCLGAAEGLLCAALRDQPVAVAINAALERTRDALVAAGFERAPSTSWHDLTRPNGSRKECVRLSRVGCRASATVAKAAQGPTVGATLGPWETPGAADAALSRLAPSVLAALGQPLAPPNQVAAVSFQTALRRVQELVTSGDATGLDALGFDLNALARVAAVEAAAAHPALVLI